MADIPYLYLCLACVFIQEEEVGRGGEWPVVWNVPSFQCRQHGVNLSRVLESWGLAENSGGEFRGERVAILYDPGEFPALLQTTRASPPVARNGGVPQEGSLSRHLTLLARDIAKLVPDPDFSGLGVLDFEHWRPVWRQNWASLDVYREYSRAVEKRNHPLWFNSLIELEAMLRWETSGKSFMLESLRLAKRLRPRALWAYYGFPYCFNFTPHNNRASCSNQVVQDNEQTEWLFDASSVLYPSLYLRQRGFNSAKRVDFMVGRLREARRVAAHRRTPVYPYLRFKYPDTNRFLSPTDMMNSLMVSKEAKTAGAVVWGASNDVNSEAKCLALYRYVDTVLGPAVLQVSSRSPSSSPSLLDDPGLFHEDEDNTIDSDI